MFVLKGSAILFFLLVVHGTFWDCGTKSIQKSKKVQIRVINNTGYNFTNVSMYSMPFDDLQPNDTSEYKELAYDSLRHDPLIYCMNGDTNYGRYLVIPKEETEYCSYVIDSISNRIIWVSLQIDR